jgi:hypothetical protein
MCMKYLLSLLSIFLFLTGLHAQSDTIEPPSHNKQIIDFVNEHIGKKVGTGMCADLLIEALGNDSFGYWWTHCRVIDINQIKPGDIVDIDSIPTPMRKGKIKYDGHVGIVYRVNANHSVITVAEQNITTAKGKKRIKYGTGKAWLAKESYVVLSIYSPDELHSIGKITFQRW